MSLGRRIQRYFTGGDLLGREKNPKVVKIQGRAVQDASPSDGQFLKWVNANSQWEPATATAIASGSPFRLVVACSDETTALATGTSKITFRMPAAVTLTNVRASLSTAQTSGTIFTVDINEGGTTILSTKITIDNTEKTSASAATPPVLSDTSIADDAEITVDIDQIGDGTAKGLKVTFIGTYT